ncbi:MAG TPA: nicotinate phosphoribosyltransferase [Terriglobia bacterium]|nr:nicotinate phosphoribosyltransferase [Terriglobia bacterium]
MMPEANPDRGLLTDLYELTMAAGYFEHHVNCRATFELFVRQLPPERSYLVAAGLDSAIGYLENLRFTDADVEFLRGLPSFRKVSDAFFDYLRSFRFTGDVNAVPEGTLIFGGEPILQVTAPVAEAQIVETYLLSAVNYETLVASKAARVVTAAGGRPVWEFGTRRAQGPQAGVRAGRAAYVGGCAGTSNVLAGYLYGVPVAGTAAHSWTQVFPSERESFAALLETFPDTATLLIDTYDTLAGAETAAQVARELGRKIKAVRLDSGDLLVKSRQVRGILDRHGLHETEIFASGDLNEYKIADLVEQGAPIDSFGVGTDLATSRDVPALGVVYKLVEIEHDGRVEYKTKFSAQKAHWPGRKQVFRFARDVSERAEPAGTAGEGSRERFHHDLIARADERYADCVPLLEPVMRRGRRLGPRPALGEIRARTLASLERLPQRYQSLDGGPRYPVATSPALERLLEEVRERYVVEPAVAHAARVPSEGEETLVFLDVDTQVDFMSPSGALYAPGAETIIPNLKRLMDFARAECIPVLSSADAHRRDDPSFAQWPPHCVIGTPGQRRIPETQFPSETVISNRAGDFHPPADWRGQFVIEIEKSDYSVAANPNFDAVLAALGPCRFVVFGVATEYCVRDSVLALRRLNIPVELVTDAIRPITEEGGRKAIEEMVAAGVRLTSTEEVCSGALQATSMQAAVRS